MTDYKILKQGEHGVALCEITDPQTQYYVVQMHESNGRVSSIPSENPTGTNGAFANISGRGIQYVGRPHSLREAEQLFELFA